MIIHRQKMVLNDAGRIAADEWIKTALIRDEIQLDEWVVMPNHFHGIVIFSTPYKPAYRHNAENGLKRQKFSLTWWQPLYYRFGL